MRQVVLTARCAMSLALALLMVCSTSIARAQTRDDLSNEAQLALDWLYRTNPTARALGQTARAVVVFPRIAKAKIVRLHKTSDAAYGKGALIKGGATTDFRHFVSRSWRLHDADASYSVALFVMTAKAQDALAKGGWELGKGPRVTIVNAGEAKSASAVGLKNDAYAFVFGQKPSAPAVSLQGSRILPQS